MSKHGGTFHLSGETRDLLRENQEFFKEVLESYDPQDPEKIPLKFKSGDPESRSEAKIQPDGGIEVSFVIPLDSDADPENGRVYLRDTFVFDPSEKRLKSYQRDFEYNGKGEGNWAAWLEKYRETHKANTRSIDDPVVQKFAFSAGASFGRPLTDKDGKTLPDFAKAYGRQHAYLDSNHHMVESNWQDLNYKLKDKANHYTLVRKDDQIHITFHVAVDGDDDPLNGRLILNDTISVDAKTWELKNFARVWTPARELSDSEEWKGAADRMNQIWTDTADGEKKEVAGKAQAFVLNMASLLLTGNDVEPKDAWKALLSSAKTGAAEPSVFAQRLEKDPRRGEATPQILEAIGVLANESIARKQDADLGWWNRRVLRHGSVDLERIQKSNIEVVKKAIEAAKAKPNATAFETLKSLTLEGDEALAREYMLSNKLAIELDSIGGEADPELRARSLLHFADHRLFRRMEMFGSAQNILTSLQNSPFVRDKAQAVLETMAGRGNFGMKFEAFVPRFTKQLTHPATLIAMTGAPFLGVAAEGAGLAGLSRLAAAVGGSGRVNFAGRWLAGGLGLTGEAFAFTALHQAGASAVHDPNKVMANFGNEFLSGVLLFGAMRAAHAGVNPLTARIFTKTPTEAQLLTSPTGRVLINPRWGGGEANWFSRNVFMPLVNHGTGIAGMHVANNLSRYFRLIPDDGQDGFSHFLDSGLGYAQAMIGFNLANRMTMGRLQGGLGEAKLRLESYGRDLGQVPIGKKSRMASNGPKAPSQAFNFNGKWKLEKPGEQKMIWIGSVAGRRKGVEYLEGYAKLNIGPEDTVSEYHAVLIRDRSNSFWYAADAGSTYGTFVGTTRLKPGEYVRFKNGQVLQLGDSYQLRIDVDGKLLSPDPKAQLSVEVPQAPAQKRLGPPPIAETFPFEKMYSDFDPYPPKEIQAAQHARNEEVKPLTFEIAQLRPVKDGESWKLTSATTFWGDPKTVHFYVDKNGRFVLENLSFDDIEVHRPARGQQGAEFHRLVNHDPKFISEEQRLAGHQNWVFLESGDRISFGKQELEFIAHDVPVGDQLKGTSRALGHSERPPARDSVPPQENDFDPMGDRPTQMNLKPVSADGTHSENSEITQAMRPRLTSVQRIDGPVPVEYLENIPPGTPLFELLLNGRVIGQGDPHSTSYIIGTNPDTSLPYQSSITVEGRKLEHKHAELFLARTPSGEGWQWYLTDKDSTHGTFLGGKDGRKLDSGANREYISLHSGSSFSLGAPAGKIDAVEFAFRLPWSALSVDPGKPASSFPLKLIRNFAPDQAPMELVDNFGNSVLVADRKTTRYILGRNPESREGSNSRTVTLNRDRIDDEHCEIFLSESGQWYLRVLTMEEKTYIDGKELTPGATVPITPKAEIALGGDAKQGHGMTFILRKDNYATDLESDTPTIKPPPPGSQAAATPVADGAPAGEARAPRAAKPRPKVPPQPPRARPASEGDFSRENLSDTLIMQPETSETLARRSVELEEPQAPPPPPRQRQPSRPPTPGPNVVRRTNPPQPPAKPEPAPPPAPAKPEKEAPPPVRDETDFGDLNSGLIESQPAPAAPVAARQTGSRDIPPAAPGLVEPVIPQNSPVPRVALHDEAIPRPPRSPLEEAIAGAQEPKPVNPALTEMHPELRSQYLLDSLGPWLTMNKAQMRKKVEDIKTFPRHNPRPNAVSTSETLPLYLGQVLKWEAAARQANNNQMVKFTDATKAALKELIDAKVGGEFPQTYDVSFDGQTLFYGSQGFANPNTSLTMKIKPGTEAEVLKGLHRHLLTLDVPVQITAPLSTEAPSTYLGILYRAEDAVRVHQAVRNYASEHKATIATGKLPFTHMLKGENGRAILGVGVMEYFIEGTAPTPLDHRFRAAALPSFTTYATKAEEAKAYDPKRHAFVALDFYQKAGYDMANPGFRAGSLAGSHSSLVNELYFPE